MPVRETKKRRSTGRTNPTPIHKIGVRISVKAPTAAPVASRDAVETVERRDVHGVAGHHELGTTRTRCLNILHA